MSPAEYEFHDGICASCRWREWYLQEAQGGIYSRWLNIEKENELKKGNLR
jgi:hypothetical protein